MLPWLEDAFYKNLEFGTGEDEEEKLVRGRTGWNVYTIRKASEGLAKYIKSVW